MEILIRAFRVVAKEGKMDEFREFFLGEAVPIVTIYGGLVGMQVGLPYRQAEL
jgi:hypothetical protein